MLKKIHERKLNFEVWELFTNQVNPLVYSLGCVAAFAQPSDACKLAKKLANKSIKAGAASIWIGVLDTTDKIFYNQYYHQAPIDIEESIKKIA